MKAEGFDGATEPGQRTAAAAPQPAFGLERLLQHFKIRAQAHGIRVGLRAHRRRPWRRSPGEILIGRGKSRVHTGDCTPVGFIGACGIHIAARIRQLFDRTGHGYQLGGQRQFRAQRIQLFQIVGQQRLAGAAQCQAQRIRGDMRIAVAVAADPAAEPQETRRPHARAGAPSARTAPASPAEICLSNRPARCRLRRPHTAAHAAAPGSATATRFAPRSPPRSASPVGGFHEPGVALAHQRRDAIAVIQHALAHHLGGMRGQNRNDLRVAEQFGGLRRT